MVLKNKYSSSMIILIFILLSFLVFFIIFFSPLIIAQLGGPDNVDHISNETKDTTPAYEINISGGYISALNLTASIQNIRWKAFVGWVSGLFTLDDAGGSTIYDWQLALISGNVYATRNGSLIQWSQIKCANVTILENENLALNHSSPNDNLTATFSGTTHDGFNVAGVPISPSSCPSLYTYVDNETQSEYFQEVVLFDGVDDVSPGNLIYVTILEDSITGYDGTEYDFQMIVPEVATPGFSGATPYYLYIELV